MNLYEVFLKDQKRPMPIFADKFSCEEGGWTVFYGRRPEGFEEVARFKTSNVKEIYESVK